MKSTGYVRKLDMLGRLVVPMEIRKALDINENDKLEFYTENDSIIIKKYVPVCAFCGNPDDLSYFHEKPICKTCIEDLKGK
ncbi:MAG: AbrB/MazE/SpoVT family DNA-binding domain-containing protein [Eubacteriales bacterium]